MLGFMSGWSRHFQDETTRFLYFFVVLVIGAVSVSVLNQWTLNAAGLATLLGWGALFKGTFGILLPDLSNRIIQKVNLSPVVIYPTGRNHVDHRVLFVVLWFCLLNKNT